MHPFTSLNEEEIRTASRNIRSTFDAGTKLRFKGISLLEPTKLEIKKFDAGTFVPDRKAWVNYYLIGTPFFFEVVVNITTQIIESSTEVPVGFHGPCDDDEIMEVEKLTMADPTVQAEIAKLQLPPGAVVVCDPWIWYAYLLSY